MSGCKDFLLASNKFSMKPAKDLTASSSEPLPCAKAKLAKAQHCLQIAEIVGKYSWKKHSDNASILDCSNPTIP